MAGENRFEKSFNSSCCPVTGRGLGFNGQACEVNRNKGETTDEYRMAGVR